MVSLQYALLIYLYFKGRVRVYVCMITVAMKSGDVVLVTGATNFFQGDVQSWRNVPQLWSLGPFHLELLSPWREWRKLHQTCGHSSTFRDLCKVGGGRLRRRRSGYFPPSLLPTVMVTRRPFYRD